MSNKRIVDFPEMTAPVANDDLFLIWDSSVNKTKAIRADDMPGGGGTGGGSGDSEAALGSPWAVRNNSLTYQYDEETGNSTITDGRLLGKTDYAVTSTQMGGGEFRDSMLTYDADLGSVTILGFQLEDGEKIRIYADGVLTAENEEFFQQIDNLAKITAPFLNTITGAGGAKVLWMRPLGEIPAGWQECVAMRGVIPVGLSLTDDDFKTLNATGGNKTHKIDSIGKLPKHRFNTVINQDYVGDSFPSEIGRMINAVRSMIRSWTKGYGGGKESYYLYGATQDNSDVANVDGTYTFEPTLSPTNYLGKADPDAINHMNPYRVVYWIEFIGIA